jgi:hypothetical protein
LTPRERELLVTRIVSGTLRVEIGGEAMMIRQPDRDQRYLAQQAYQDAYDEAAAHDCHTEETLLAWMKAEGYWSNEEEKALDGLEKDIENLKVGLFKAFASKSKSAVARTTLIAAKAKRDELHAKRHAFDSETCTSHAWSAKLRVLVGASLFNRRNLLVQNDTLIDEAVSQFLSHRLTETQYRELARTDPWRTTWACRRSEGAVFGIPACDLTEEQRNLSAYSTLYDNVGEHPERPSDEVIAEDDALDGWLILQRREHEGERRKKRAEDFVSNEKILNSNEVFVVVDNDEDARSIEELNDSASSFIKKQRMHYLAQKGVVQEADMPDQRLFIQSEVNRKAMENVK